MIAVAQGPSLLVVIARKQRVKSWSPFAKLAGLMFVLVTTCMVLVVCLCTRRPAVVVCVAVLLMTWFSLLCEWVRDRVLPPPLPNSLLLSARTLLWMLYPPFLLTCLRMKLAS